jgi:hypothetical protein
MLGGTTDLMQTTVLNALIPVLHVIWVILNRTNCQIAR